MPYILATQVRVGMIINFENELCRVISVEHQTPGNLPARIADEDEAPQGRHQPGEPLRLLRQDRQGQPRTASRWNTSTRTATTWSS